MTAVVIPNPDESALQKEQRLFNDLSSRLGNAILNRIFDLRPDSAARRFRNLMLGLIAVSFLISLRYYPLSLWAKYTQDVFLFALNPQFAREHQGNPILALVAFAWSAFTDPRVFQYFPIFLASFFIALQSAAIYLSDVFELEDVSVARRFVWGVALAGSEETIRVMQGEVPDAFRETPTFLIGGPGKVVVDLDSVALFEKPDGTPHVIGPTGREPGGRATLDGFERFRQAIDLRDHYVDLRDQDPKSQSVRSRSRDGIPITATDVRLMFSVYRGEQDAAQTAMPYPFSKEAVEQIIYKSASRVTPDLPNPSTYEFSWINNMIGLIRGRLSGFMNEHKLTAYLASTGMPEFEKAKRREETIAEDVEELAHSSNEEPVQSKSVSPPPDFKPRYMITDLFSQFAEAFTQSAHNSGVELKWIGVGTWKTPPEIEIVPEKHLEAWKLSQENSRSGSDGALLGAKSEATMKKMEALIQDVPINAYHEIVGYGTKSTTKKASKKIDTRPKDPPADMVFSSEDMEDGLDNLVKLFEISKMFNERALPEHVDTDHRRDMQQLLLEYRKQFLETIEFMKTKNEAIPPFIEDAVQHINSVLGFRHWAGRG